MKQFTTIMSVILCLTFFSNGAYAGAMAPEPYDPKKKRPGEECKNSDECQKHHSCHKEGEKGVCVAPPPPKLPPGVVT